MFQGDNAEIEAIERRIIAALDLDRVSTTDAIDALCNLMILTWAQIACPDCRKVAADRLRTAVPKMLAEAALIAADCRDLATGVELQHLH